MTKKINKNITKEVASKNKKDDKTTKVGTNDVKTINKVISKEPINIIKDNTLPQVIDANAPKDIKSIDNSKTDNKAQKKQSELKSVKKDKSTKITKTKKNTLKSLNKVDLTAYREVFRLAKGKLTLSDFATKCKVPTALFGTKQNPLYPSETVLKAISEYADNEVTYEELQLALSGKVYAGRNFSQKVDLDKVADFTKKAMGDKSISQFSFSNKISRCIISSILQKKIEVVTPKLIEKISLSFTDDEKEELYAAFGYPVKSNVFISDDKTPVSIYAKELSETPKNTTTSLKNTADVVHKTKEFEKISDVRWTIFKKDVFNKFFKYYNYQQINDIVPMSQEDYWDLKEDDKTQIKMSYQKYKKYVIKLTSLPLCKNNAMEMLSYLRLDDEQATPQWKYRNYLDILFVNDSRKDIAEKTGLSLNTINAFDHKISDRSIKILSQVYKHISENELLKYAKDAGILLMYDNRGANKKTIKSKRSKK